MDLGLAGKAVLVTGASRGIGRAIAFGFAEEGARLAVCARGAERLMSAAADLRGRGTEVVAVAADVTRAEDRARLVEESLGAFGALDVVVHNVGGGGAASFSETTEAHWAEALALDVLAPVELNRLLVPQMMARRDGAIIFISSLFGREWGGRPAYMTVKAAEIALAKALARELAPHGVRVNSVAPGSILFEGGSWDRRRKQDPERIARFVASDLPLSRFGTPEEVANVVVFLASPRASLVVGACVSVDGCQSRSLI